VRGPEVEVPVLLQEGELPPAPDAWDAWDGAHRGARDEAVRRALAGADAGKLAVPAQGGPVLDELRPEPERLLAPRAELA